MKQQNFYRYIRYAFYVSIIIIVIIFFLLCVSVLLLPRTFAFLLDQNENEAGGKKSLSIVVSDVVFNEVSPP